MVPFSSFAQTGWTTTPTSLSRFLGYPSYELQGQGAPGVSSGEAMDSDRGARLADPRRQRRLGRPVLSGAAVLGPGADPLRRLADRRLPLPRRALRKLVDPGRGAARHSARPGRRDLRGDAARPRRTTSICRSACITTMGLSAKNAILMVEFAERAEREGKRVIEAAIEAARIRLAADPDDQLRLHLRRAAAGALDRRRRQQPHRDRHRGDRRHADRDHPRRSSTFRSSSCSSGAACAMALRSSASVCAQRKAARHEALRRRCSRCWRPACTTMEPKLCPARSGDPAVMAGRRSLSPPGRGRASRAHLQADLPRSAVCRR